MSRWHVFTAILFAVISAGCQSDGFDTQEAGKAAEVAKGQASVPLEGTVWEFVEIDGAPVIQYDLEDTPRIEFIPTERTISAWLSCNRFAGTYETDGTTLLIRPTPVTWRDCVDSNEQEEAIRRVLHSTESYSIEGGRLRFHSGGRVTALLVPWNAE
jgi:heat shock protein HslJ